MTTMNTMAEDSTSKVSLNCITFIVLVFLEDFVSFFN